jgi:diguanylate cyclase (GGDEF)-like protein
MSQIAKQEAGVLAHGSALVTAHEPVAGKDHGAAVNDAHMERAYVELRQHATSLVQAWEKLNSGRWNGAHGRGLQLAAKQLVRACERLRLSLTRKAGELETFIRVFVDTALTPNSEQLRALSALVSTLASTVLALDLVNAARDTAAPVAGAIHPAVPVPGRPLAEPVETAAPAPQQARPVADDLLLLIGEVSEFGVDLAPSFIEHGYAVRTFARPDGALALLRTTVPRAMVIGSACANAIPQLRQAAASREAVNEHHREPALAVVTPRADLGRRLVALRQGVKYFEPPLDPLALLVAVTSETVAIGSPSRVLLVDADRDRAHQSALWLKDAGYIVRICTSAADALTAVESFKPQVAVVDADLRGADSLNLVHGLRDDASSAEIPVILVASSRELATREQAIAGGADEYLLKPVKPRHLISVIESRLKRSRRFTSKRVGNRDEATGLYPRREFIERAEAAKGQVGAVALYIALDEAEPLRKQLGISGQNRLDIAVGQALKENLRAEDLPALYQDCKYLVLLRRANRTDAMASAESLRESLSRRRIAINDREVALNASLGLATLDVESADVAVQNAEAAALAAMHLGGNRSVWYESRSASLVPAERDAQLRGLVQSRRFGQYMEVRGAALLPLRGRVSGQYELLLMWRPGGLGQAAASFEDLVGAAREASCIGDFDRFVVGEALTVRAEQLKRGRQLRLSVELSSHILEDGGFAEYLENLLRERRLSGTGLAIIIPASVLVERMDALIAFCQHMKPLAIRVGLKDIGRDMTLVHRLRGVPVDFLRLSPELSTAAASSERAGELLTALVRRAHQSGMAVFACGVDTREQLSQLQILGVDYAESPTQGPATPHFDFDFARYQAAAPGVV